MTDQALVILENNQALTTSLIVAEFFKKNHKEVMRTIDNLVEQVASASQSANLRSDMFVKSSYQSEDGGRNYPMYLMNRDGFSLLAMGFTGKKALQFKLKFIAAFNQMEETLKTLSRPQITRDNRWVETRQMGKVKRKALTQAIKILIDYLRSQGETRPDGYIYGHLTNLIQNDCEIEKCGRDNATVKKLNKLDQVEDMTANVILKCITTNIKTLAEVESQILLQIRRLNNLLSGQLMLSD